MQGKQSKVIECSVLVSGLHRPMLVSVLSKGYILLSSNGFIRQACKENEVKYSIGSCVVVERRLET